ncbi:MAG: hypothetical protein LW832_02060 [Parachlamydia sp.]|jgi:hypothetical protein|nr:hypothetical protein [Parachlamydia sp.]
MFNNIINTVSQPLIYNITAIAATGGVITAVALKALGASGAIVAAGAALSFTAVLATAVIAATVITAKLCWEAFKKAMH